MGEQFLTNLMLHHSRLRAMLSVSDMPPEFITVIELMIKKSEELISDYFKLVEEDSLSPYPRAA